MRIHQLPILLMAALPIMAAGKQLSSDEALQRALSSTESTRMHSPASQLTGFSNPTFTAKAGDLNAFYVFNRAADKGFAIIAADDCAAPVLAYADEGAFDPDNMPDNLSWWLSQYQQEIAQAMARGTQYKAPANAPLQPIAPLIKTAWDQVSPYNNACPERYDRHAMAGCVAIAMGQIMKYHQWPPKGQDANTYSCAYGELTLDFSQYTYDWDNMLDEYDQDSPEEAKKAVADLIYSCGVAVNMKFNTNESVADSRSIPIALTKYFDYDKGIRFVKRNFLYFNEWQQLIYDELNAGRPVLYDGQSASGTGHQFVCDGYNDGFFHFNWGWGGRSNGFFRLTALEPQNLGVGAGDGEYNFNHNIIVGIQPSKGTPELIPIVYPNGDFTTGDASYPNPYVVTFTTTNAAKPGFYNCTNGELILNFGIKVVDSQGSVKYIQDLYTPTTLQYNSFVRNFMVFVTDLPQGTYTVYPAFVTADGVWHDMTMMAYNSNAIKMTVTESTIDFEDMPYDADIVINDFRLDTPVYVDRHFRFSATMTAQREYVGEVKIYMFQPGSETMVLSTYPISVLLQPGAPTELNLVSKLSFYPAALGAPEPGEYELQIVDSNGKPMSNRIAINYATAPESKLELVDLRLATGDHAPADDIHLMGTVKCTEGYFSNQVQLYLFRYHTTMSASCFVTPMLIANEGESVDFDVRGRFTNAKPGDLYYIQAVAGSQWLNDGLFFTIDDPLGTVKIIGDANGDNIITVADAALAIARMEGLNPVNLDFDLTDMNHDGYIGYNDFEAILYKTLGGEFSFGVAESIPSETGKDFAISNLRIDPGQYATFDIALPAMTDKRAFQFDLVLPGAVHVTSVSFVSESDTPAQLLWLHNKAAGITRVAAAVTSNTTFAATDIVRVKVRADFNFDCVGRILLYNALADTWVDNDIVESRAASASASIIRDNYQGISDAAADGLDISVNGRCLVITADAECVVTVTDVLGRVTSVTLGQGENRIELPAAGIYMVGGHKIVVK